MRLSDWIASSLRSSQRRAGVVAAWLASLGVALSLSGEMPPLRMASAALGSPQAYFIPSKHSHCERSEAIQAVEKYAKMSCFVI